MAEADNGAGRRLTLFRDEAGGNVFFPSTPPLHSTEGGAVGSWDLIPAVSEEGKISRKSPVAEKRTRGKVFFFAPQPRQERAMLYCFALDFD